MHKLTLLAASTLLASASAFAGQGDMWVNAHLMSKHGSDNYTDIRTDEIKPYNETNLGLGLEYEMKDNSSIRAGFFDNSHNETSVYGLVNVHTSYGTGVSVGINVGLATGYEARSGTTVTMVVLPAINFQYDRVRVELGAIPAIGEYSSVMTLSAGVRF